MTEGTGKRSDIRSAIARMAKLAAGLAVFGACGCSSASTSASSANAADRSWGTEALSVWHPRDAVLLKRLALANAMTRSLAAESAKQGAVTDEELSSWTEYHWAQVDRPAVFRTAHAVVMTAANANPTELEKAERVANAIHAAVAGSPDEKTFKARAQAVDKLGLEVKVEGLDFVAEDGRVMRLGADASAQGGAYDVAFARAAAALSTVGQVSPVTRSKFGFHVIRLEETLPPIRLDIETRRAMAQADVLERRARLALQALLTDVRQRLEPSLERSAEEATSKVSVE